ncbi:phospholipase A [uncultured Piscinibacter sp.]|uniref:phospholipase A n=1 Tax=uncultured Piscinibacter sp. TaxID=1131835 RepID=UPI002625C958|nr:phospholipase A [uncultured Piscinibacter sp.]
MSRPLRAARWLAPLALALPTVAMAQAAAADCVAMQDAAARLACYDRLHGRAAPETPAAAPAAEPAAPSAPPTSNDDRDSKLGTRWDLDGQRSVLFAPRAYKPVYLLPATWTDRVNRLPSSPAPDHSAPSELILKSVEAKYQISFKAKFAHSLFGAPVSLWGGYTQSSRWQVYNGADSRPFRETNYEPELMLVAPLEASLLGWRLRMASLSLNHQSNGRALPLSRSWNRVIAGLALERGDWVAELRPWARIREEASDDDNPDIADHVGRAEMRLARYWGDHTVSLQLRHSLRGGDRSRGSAQLDYVFPLADAMHGYFQLFGGYGESLIDYNLRQTKAGLGITIAGWR